MTRTWTINGTLTVKAAKDSQTLLADPVAKAIAMMKPADTDAIGIAAIDPGMSDVAEFCQHYQVPLAASVNCVIVRGRRGARTRYAACIALATTKVNINTVARRHLAVDKAEVADPADAVERVRMDSEGFTAIGLPTEWPILIDAAVAAAPELVVGAGTKAAKLFVSGGLLADLPDTEVVDGLAG